MNQCNNLTQGFHPESTTNFITAVVYNSNVCLPTVRAGHKLNFFYSILCSTSNTPRIQLHRFSLYAVKCVVVSYPHE